MKKWKKLLLAVLPLTLTMAFTSLAGEWKQDDTGWWYQNDDGSYYNDGWHWVDGDGDGMAECYFFGFDGYMAKGPGEVGGYWINEDGAWISEDGVQRKQVSEIPQQQTGNTGGAGNEDAYAIYRNAVVKNSSLDSLDANCKYNMTMSMAGESIPMTMDLNMKMKGVRSGNLQFILSGNMSMLGMDIPMTAFYTDGYYYMDTMGEKMKTSMPMDQAVREANSNIKMTEVDVSSMKNLTMRTEGEYTVLSYTMDVVELTGTLNSMIGESMGNYNYRVNSTTGETYINKDGYYTKEKIYIDMDMTVEGQNVNCKMIVEMDILNPGQAVDFAIPSTEGFQESATV